MDANQSFKCMAEFNVYIVGKLSGYDGVFYYFGEGQVCNFDGTTLVQGHRNLGRLLLLKYIQN